MPNFYGGSFLSLKMKR